MAWHVKIKFDGVRLDKQLISGPFWIGCFSLEGEPV